MRVTGLTNDEEEEASQLGIEVEDKNELVDKSAVEYGSLELSIYSERWG